MLANRPSRAALALALVVPAPTIGVLGAMQWWPSTALGAAVFAAAKLWMVLVPVVWRLAVERERVSLSPVRHGGLGAGAVLGVAISAAILGAYALLGASLVDAEQVQVAAEANGIAHRGRFLALAAYWILVNSVLEEFVYRWFIFRQCERLMPSGLAVLASAAAFTVHHVLALRFQMDWGVTLLGSAGVFVGGALWSWLYARYRSIWPAYVSHAIVDVAVYIVGWRLIFG